MIYRLIISAIILSATLLPGWGSCASADDSDDLLEYKIKTAFLYNFAKFVAWPSTDTINTSRVFTIGIIASPEFASTAKLLQDKNVKGAPVKIIFFEPYEELLPCNMLFIGVDDETLILNVIDRFKDSPVLTVADSSGFASQGGIINFITVDDTIRFEINPEAAETKHLKISSKLLSLARIVGTAGSEKAEK